LESNIEFAELKRSLKEAVAISRGEKKASRRFVLDGKAQKEQARLDVKNLVAKSPQIIL
jgi:hypothetical protein